MKTPEQIASEAMDAFTFIDPHSVDDNDVAEQDFYYIKDQIEAAIEADRAQRKGAVVVIRDGSAYENEDVEVIDLDFLDPNAITHQSDFIQEDIDRMLTALERGGFHEAADDVREWWADQ